jgi:hypothetical protein
MLRSFEVGANGDPEAPVIFSTRLPDGQRITFIEAVLVAARLKSPSGEVVAEIRRGEDHLVFVEPPLFRNVRVDATTFIGAPNLATKAGTGITIRAGQTIKLSRHGEWRWGRTKKHVGAEQLRIAIGIAEQRPKQIRAVPATLEFVAEQSGELFLGIDDSATQDNSGYLLVEIEIIDSLPEQDGATGD